MHQTRRNQIAKLNKKARETNAIGSKALHEPVDLEPEADERFEDGRSKEDGDTGGGSADKGWAPWRGTPKTVVEKEEDDEEEEDEEEEAEDDEEDRDDDEDFG